MRVSDATLVNKMDSLQETVATMLVEVKAIRQHLADKSAPKDTALGRRAMSLA